MLGGHLCLGWGLDLEAVPRAGLSARVPPVWAEPRDAPGVMMGPSPPASCSHLC